MLDTTKSLAVLSLALGLCACGGGGGGGSAVGGTATGSSSSLGFTRFSDLTPGIRTRIQGSSQEAAYTWDAVTNTITSVGPVSQFGPTAAADITVDSNRNLNSISFTSAAGTLLSFSTAAGDTIVALPADNRIAIAISTARDKEALFSNATVLGWEYQSFGIWATGLGTGSGTVGSFSVGSQTPVSGIPTSGQATYTGVAGGRYVDESGGYFYTVSGMTAVTDFGNRTLSFSTSGTQQSRNLAPGTLVANNNLNLAGNLTYAPDNNRFSGTVSTAGGGVGNGAMTGTATGYFYGPLAQEIGGGFAVGPSPGSPSGTPRYIGSFGGKRP